MKTIADKIVDTLYLFTALACATLCLANAGANAQEVSFPEDSKPAPVPVVPSSVQKVPYGTLYVFTAKSNQTVIASPKGIVSVVKKTKSLDIYAMLYGGVGDYEYKTYTSEFIWIVKPVVTGTCELVVVPVGETEDKAQRKTLEIVNGPTPPLPGPVDPPKPVDPPQPLDGFTKSLQAAYAKETAVNKAKQLTDLATFYSVVKDSKILRDEAIRTCGQLITSLHNSCEEVVGAGVLLHVRSAIADELDKQMKTQNVTGLTVELRDKYSQQFTKIAESLAKVTK